MGDNLKRRIVMIDMSEHAACQMCGKITELRPYGPKGESVCFECGMKDEEAAKRAFDKLTLGADVFYLLDFLKGRRRNDPRKTDSTDS